MIKAFTNQAEIEVKYARAYTAPYQKKSTMNYIVVRDNVKSIRLVFDIKLKDVVIRPKRYDIGYEIQDDYTVIVYPEGNYNFSVEPNGKIDNSVLIFNCAADELKRSDYDNIIYFGKERYFVNNYEIKEDNTLVYIEEGGTVDGIFIAKNKKNLGFDGYGEITLENYDMRTRLIYLYQCENIKIQNLILKDSTNWNICLEECKNIDINNVKVLGCFGNSDGIDMCSCENASVKNCFMRTWDDCLVVKGLGNGICRNLHYKDCVLWNDFARPMEIGVETCAEEISNIVFEDIDVVHSVTRYPVMGIHHGDRAKIHDICFKNITVEDTPGAQPFDIRITKSGWNRDDMVGNIRNVEFKNITFLEEKGNKILPYHSRIQGYSKESDISGIIFEDIKFGDKTADSIEGLGLEILDFASNIEVRKTVGEKRLPIHTSINVEKEGFEDGCYILEAEITFENTSDVQKEGTCCLAVSPERRAEYEQEIVFNIPPRDKVAVKRSIRIPAGRYAFSLSGENTEIESAFAFVNLELCLGKDFSECPIYYFSDSYGNSLEDGIQFAIDNDCLAVKTELLKKCDLKLYAAEVCEEQAGEMLFSIEDSNSGYAPALTKGKDGGCTEAPQIGCPEEISFVFKNYPKVQINSTKLRKRLNNTAYIPLKSIGIESRQKFRIELIAEDRPGKRYDFSLFGSPIPKETIREPRVMAHMFVHIVPEEH